MTVSEITKRQLAELLVGASVILTISYLLTFGARYSWMLDLFTHFRIQYVTGALVLCLLFFLLKKRRLAAFMIVIACANIWEIYRHVEIVSRAPQMADFTVVQYNRRYDLPGHEDMENWIRNNAEKFDVVVMQEARITHQETAESLKDLYPYQIHEPRENAFGMVIVSKYPILDQTFIPFRRFALDNFGLRLVVQPPQKQPVAIYALHPPPPTNHLLLMQRNTDLDTAAEALVKDPVKNVIMLGDWNMTPYSPYFSDLLKKTGLHYQITQPYPFTTWPWHFMFPFLQLPIDHILSKGSLTLVEKIRGPAMGSDHYPVIASFALGQAP